MLENGWTYLILGNTKESLDQYTCPQGQADEHVVAGMLSGCSKQGFLLGCSHGRWCETGAMVHGRLLKEECLLFSGAESSYPDELGEDGRWCPIGFDVDSRVEA